MRGARWVLVGLAAIALAGCEGGLTFANPAQIRVDCRASQGRQFVSYANCVSAAMYRQNWVSGDDLAQLYLARMTQWSQAVSAGAISDTDAFAYEAETIVNINNAIQQRNANAAVISAQQAPVEAFTPYGRYGVPKPISCMRRRDNTIVCR